MISILFDITLCYIYILYLDVYLYSLNECLFCLDSSLLYDMILLFIEYRLSKYSSQLYHIISNDEVDLCLYHCYCALYNTTYSTRWLYILVRSILFGNETKKQTQSNTSKLRQKYIYSRNTTPILRGNYNITIIILVLQNVNKQLFLCNHSNPYYTFLCKIYYTLYST